MTSACWLPDTQRALALPGENDGDSFELRDVAAEPVMEDGLQEAAGVSSGGHLRCPAAREPGAWSGTARQDSAAPSSPGADRAEDEFTGGTAGRSVSRRFRGETLKLSEGSMHFNKKNKLNKNKTNRKINCISTKK